MVIQLHKTIVQDDSWGWWCKVGEPVWYADCPFQDKDVPKQAGFSWNRDKKKWYTGDRSKAAKLADYAVDTEVREDLSKVKKYQVISLAASRAASTNKNFPCPEGLDYFPFQKAGIEYATTRDNTLIGDDMGLGKTIQAIGVINYLKSKKVLVVCPATIKQNWKNEINTWSVDDLKIGISDSNNALTPEYGYNVTIINYEALRNVKINNKISEVSWDVMILDECHNIKNQKTISYMGIAGGESKSGKKFCTVSARRIIALTGTPILNRPSELWSIITLLDPGRWNSNTYWYYHKRYCSANRTGYGVDTRGAGSPERLEELQQILRETIMIRRMKNEVLKELPPKMRQIIELDYDEGDERAVDVINAPKKYEDRITEIEAKKELAKVNSESEEEYKKTVEKLDGEMKFAFEEMAALRKETVMAKIPYAIKFIEQLLESGEKVVIGCWHHEVIEAITNKWPLESMSIYGKVKIEDRQMNVDRFQMDDNCRIAVVGIKAGGVGITLTAASTVVVLEWPWTPGDLTQFEDRVYRIGQDKPVSIYNLVLKGSIDVMMAKLIVKKQNIIDSALNNEPTGQEVLDGLAATSKAASKKSTIKKIEEESLNITPEISSAVLKAICYMCETDTDRASSLNGVGFNKIDSAIGHSLAERGFLTNKQAVLGRKIIKKYKRQIPESIYSKIFCN